jgi:hypothetical protein
MTRQLLFNVNDLANLDPLASAERESGPQSTFGKRDAYSAFVKQQQSLGGCNVTMFSLFTSYRVKHATHITGSKILHPPLLESDEHGFIVSPKTFQIGSLHYGVMRNKNVIQLSPHIPVNEDDDTSCYAILLLHSIWPNGNEDDILGSPPVTAIERLRAVRIANMLPRYVDSFLLNVLRSETVMEVQDEPQRGHELNEPADDPDVDDISPHLRVEGNEDDSDVDEDEVFEQDMLGQADVSKNGGVRENICRKKMHMLASYISVKQKLFMDNYLLQNQLTPTDLPSDPDKQFGNPKWRQFEEKIRPGKLAEKQRECFDIVISYIDGTRCGQMMMFLSGEGGTGKSEVIKLIMEYTRLYFGKTYGLYGPVVALGANWCCCK